jgi:O-antigen/teichoic acid export membrane protein
VRSRAAVDSSAAAITPAVNKTRRLAQTVATKITMVALGTAASIVISHALGPQGRGAYYVITTIASTAIVLGALSLDQAQITLWTRAANRGPVTANSLILGWAVGIVAAVAAGGIVLGLGPGIVPIHGRGMLAAGLAAVPAGTTVIYVINVLTLRSRMDVVNRGYLLGAAAQCLPLVALGIFGTLSAEWVVIVWTAATAIPLVLLLPALRGAAGRLDPRMARRTLGLGLRYHAGTAANFLLLRADIFILNALEPTTAAVGLYSLAVTLAELTKLLTDSILPVMMPTQVESRATDAAAVTAATVRMAGLLCCAAVAAMCLTAPSLVPLLYGTQFRGTGDALLALAPGLLALGTAKPMSTYLLRLSRPALMSVIYIGAMVINVGINFALIPRLGIVGASLASSIAYTLLAAAQTIWFIRVTGTRVGQLVPRTAEVRMLWVRLPQLAPARWRR